MLPPASLEPGPPAPVPVPSRERTGLGDGGYQVTYGTSFLMAVELLAAVPSIIYGMWGLFVFAPLFADYIQPVLSATFGNRASPIRAGRGRDFVSGLPLTIVSASQVSLLVHDDQILVHHAAIDQLHVRIGHQGVVALRDEATTIIEGTSRFVSHKIGVDIGSPKTLRSFQHKRLPCFKLSESKVTRAGI